MHAIIHPAIRIQQAKMAVYSVVATVILFLAFDLLKDSLPIAIGAVWAFSILGMAYYQITRSFRSVEITENSFIVKKGIFTSVSDSIPFSKVTGIHVRRSVIQRLMGTASVGIDIVGPGIEFDLGVYLVSDTEILKASLESKGAST